MNNKFTNRYQSIKLRNIYKNFGNISSLSNISLDIEINKITCILGDNGAGKSTLIKILSGVYKQDKGEIYYDNQLINVLNPKIALQLGIITVYQDLDILLNMSIWRNFFLYHEPLHRKYLFKTINIHKAKQIVKEELVKFGVYIDDLDAPISTLSGGNRQSVIIARALYFNARVLILDEPTAALGVKQSNKIIEIIKSTKNIAIVYITHNPNHAYEIGDKFIILNNGRNIGTFTKDQINKMELINFMMGVNSSSSAPIQEGDL